MLGAFREVFNPLPTQRARVGFLMICLLLLTCLFYAPVFQNDFVNWDDIQTITQNSNIRTINVETIKWMFTTLYTAHWMPLTWLSFSLDNLIYGMKPMGFHLTNLALHCMNVLIVFVLTIHLVGFIGARALDLEVEEKDRFAIKCGFLSAILFGLHPLRVESVAWATERKDVLYSFFYLLSLCVYLVRARGNGSMAWKDRHVLCLILFVCSVMSKLMAVTLPMVLLILDFWPLKRLSKGALLEKTPYFLVSLGGGALAIVASMGSAFSLANNIGLYYRMVNPIRSLFFYIVKTVFPFNLSPVYPFALRFDAEFYIEVVFSILAFILVCVTLLRWRQNRPYLIAAWFFYIVALLPVLGILQIGNQAAADRYIYMASLGISIPLSVLITRWISKSGAGWLMVSLVAAVILGLMTSKQVGIWKNSRVLWERAVQIYPDQSSFAHGNLGATYQSLGMDQEAYREFQRSIAIPPPRAMSYNGLGVLYFKAGKSSEAIQYLKYAMSLEPKYISPRLNLWLGYQRLGMKNEALEEIRRVIQIEPNVPEHQFKLGQSFMVLGDKENAKRAFTKACEMAPMNEKFQEALNSLLLNAELQGFKNR